MQAGAGKADFVHVHENPLGDAYMQQRGYRGASSACTFSIVTDAEVRQEHLTKMVIKTSVAELRSIRAQSDDCEDIQIV